MKTGWGRAWPWVLATSFYSAFAVLQTWPLIARLGSVLPNDLGDPLLNTWIIWWNAHPLPFTPAWWNAPAFWPSQRPLAFSEVLLGPPPLTRRAMAGRRAGTIINIAFLLALRCQGSRSRSRRLTGVRRRVIGSLITGSIHSRRPLPVQVMASYRSGGVMGAQVSTAEKRWLALFGAWLLRR